jgi:hypothetical protein
MGIIYANISCDMPRDPRMIRAGWQARAVYTEAVLYCRENLTDGIIDRVALVYWMPDMPIKLRVKLLDHLASVGALEAHELGWKWPDKVWQAWNPSKQEVADKREAEAKRKADYRAKKKGATDPSESVPMGQRVTATTCPRQEEEEPKGKPEPEGKEEATSVVSADMSKSEAAPAIDDDMGGIIEEIIHRCALRRTEQHPNDNPEGYRLSIEADMQRTERTAIIAMLNERPFLRAQPEKAATRYELGRRDARRAKAGA